MLPVDCHNIVNGIRWFAERVGATVTYLSAGTHGGFNEREALDILHQYSNQTHGPSLFVVTGQSNITGIRPPLSILAAVKEAALLDAAALAASTRVSLRSPARVDAMAVSFYKMFGYPTGVGALITKKSFPDTLNRPWFSGRAVDFVQSPGGLALPASDLIARFEEGALNYACLSAIEPGLDFLKRYMPSLSIRLSAIHHYIHTCLESLVYPENRHPSRPCPHQEADAEGAASVKLSSRCIRVSSILFRGISQAALRPESHIVAHRTLNTGIEARICTIPVTHFATFAHGNFIQTPLMASSQTPDGESRVHGEEGQGYVLSCTFHTSSGTMIPLSHISKLAAAHGISL